MIVDYTTDYVEVEELADESAQTIIEACKNFFSKHGRPLQFQSEMLLSIQREFRKFAEGWGLNTRRLHHTIPRAMVRPSRL